MKNVRLTSGSLDWRRTTLAVLLVMALALGVSGGVVVYASHQTAMSPEQAASGSGSVMPDMPYLQDRPTGGRVWVGWVERCSAMEDIYTFYRDDLSYDLMEGPARTAGGRVFYYLVTEDNDEFAPTYCRGQSAY